MLSLYYSLTLRSALLALYEPYIALGRDHEEGPERYGRANASIETVSEKIITQCKSLLTSSSASFESISPYLLHCIYKMAVVLIHRRNESITNNTASEDIKILINTLRVLDQRWRAAGIKRHFYLVS